ncbi:CvfB family protein [Haloimpatiens lingqiaonensis]|uniref:CvfB family protein n=1 Tax=Haloimpatiens lingqiaonensis TaxID=1380675 RepID=UPI0010FEA6DB|nr:S1-like domain-containing RNA-binding protein [Haloimpatiens lingqiaonensis]
MIELGKIQNLEVIRLTPIGVYLNSKEDKSEIDILLPQKQVPEETEVGDEIEVFVYRDSEDRLIATTRKPKINLGEVALLNVVQETKIGAFLDWGLEKDLFLPFNEQTTSVKVGREYLVYLYIDKSDRLCASMRIYKRLPSDSPYKEDDKVKGTIYSIKSDLGAFVAVDNKYQGLISKDEFYGDYGYGDEIEARVVKVKEDGKLDLSLREKAYKQMDKDAEFILEKLKMSDGILNLNDNSSPEEIKENLDMSKKAFKRAIGRLLKEGYIEFVEDGIKLIMK